MFITIKMNTFTDLTYALTRLCSDSVEDRVKEFANKHTGVSIVAICGLPILNKSEVLCDGHEELYWAGKKLDVSTVKTHFTEALGLSGMLTYMNKSNLSLEDLGELCNERNHDWGFEWMSISVLFSGYGLPVEMAFSRDTRFYMSWPVQNQPTGQLFVASGSIRSWKRYLWHKDNKDFDKSTRKAMNDTHEVISKILP